MENNLWWPEVKGGGRRVVSVTIQGQNERPSG